MKEIISKKLIQINTNTNKIEIAVVKINAFKKVTWLNFLITETLPPRRKTGIKVLSITHLNEKLPK